MLRRAPPSTTPTHLYACVSCLLGCSFSRSIALMMSYWTWYDLIFEVQCMHDVALCGRVELQFTLVQFLHGLLWRDLVDVMRSQVPVVLTMLAHNWTCVMFWKSPVHFVTFLFILLLSGKGCSALPLMVTIWWCLVQGREQMLNNKLWFFTSC